MEKLHCMRNGQFHRFMIVGGLGFCVDGAILTLLINAGSIITTARFSSFFVAVSVTWILNRIWTFSSSKIQKDKGYFVYFAIQIIGAVINLSIFFFLMHAFPDWKTRPIIPLAIGAAVSLLFNYNVSKAIVFNVKSHE